ncbi:RICIN domain-containing protein [Streptomyces alkaliphilus]|uniref:RICIN domain-containing protein n=1 Tax=Streptomyces alkaliphilus TaxID=1472722 RepID=UPI00117D24CE|nr:RICIN domain-containing protein [Streptomyces alkaliphilus]MQS09006.1 hypothetical protein [Streptomyces alkaliphilus]
MTQDKQDSPGKFAATFAAEPTRGRRGLMPGRRVLATVGGGVAAAALLTAGVVAVGAMWPQGGDRTGTVASTEEPRAPQSLLPLPAPDPKPESSPSEEEEEEEEAEPGEASQPVYIPPVQPPPAPESADPKTEEDPEPEAGDEPEAKKDSEPEEEPEPEPRSVGDTFTAGATYRLHAGTGANLCLDIGSDHTSSGVNVHQWACNGTAAQRFRFGATGTPDTFTLSISGNCLEVESSQTGPGANVRMWSCNGTATQQWRVEPLGNGAHQLVASHSGLCLDVRSSSTDRGANVAQWPCNSSVAQTWTLERL